MNVLKYHVKQNLVDRVESHSESNSPMAAPNSRKKQNPENGAVKSTQFPEYPSGARFLVVGVALAISVFLISLDKVPLLISRKIRKKEIWNSH